MTAGVGSRSHGGTGDPAANRPDDPGDLTEDTAVPLEDEAATDASEEGEVAAPPPPRVVWQGIPVGGAFLHVVRADLRSPEHAGRWAVVMDYSRQGHAERILPAGAFRFDRLPARAALEMGAALLQALAEDHARSVPLALPRQAAPAPPEDRAAHSAYAVARPAAPAAHAAPGGTTHDRDVYAACATVVELVTGRPMALAPASGDDAELGIDAACDEMRRRLGPSVAADTAVAVLRVGLARDPRDRPAARDLSRALVDVARATPGEGLDGFARRAASTPPAQAERTGPTLPVRDPPSAKPRQIPWFELGAAAALSGAVLVLLLMLVLLVQLRG